MYLSLNCYKKIKIKKLRIQVTKFIIYMYILCNRFDLLNIFYILYIIYNTLKKNIKLFLKIKL